MRVRGRPARQKGARHRKAPAGPGHPAAELLTRLNDLVSDLGENFYATCLYAVYDPAPATCTFACAGHPPPAIVRPGQPVGFPDYSPDPPLGAARPPFETREVSLPEGSLLVLYTDGMHLDRTAAAVTAA